MAKKVYAVRKGKKVGLFNTWAECKKQIDGYSGAEYKGFTSVEEAKRFLEGVEENTEIVVDSETAVAYVDGSYNKITSEFSYGVVFLYNGEEEVFYEKYDDKELGAMNNVAGEIKGSEAAMAYALEMGIKKLIIYHDYEGIAKWCNGAWKANKPGTIAYQEYYNNMKKEMEITFVKVKGHSGDKYNDMADKLAKKALGI